METENSISNDNYIVNYFNFNNNFFFFLLYEEQDLFAKLNQYSLGFFLGGVTHFIEFFFPDSIIVSGHFSKNFASEITKSTFQFLSFILFLLRFLFTNKTEK